MLCMAVLYMSCYVYTCNGRANYHQRLSLLQFASTHSANKADPLQLQGFIISAGTLYMFNKLFGGRRGYLLGFIISFGLVGVALIVQQRYNLEPCPLCISQRIIFMALGLLFLLAFLHNPGHAGRKIYALLQIVATAIGMGVAARHIWIQANPDKVMAECGAGFDYIMESFPLKKALDLIFKGTGECSAIDWTLLGLTLPQLSLIAFAGLTLLALVMPFLRKTWG